MIETKYTDRFGNELKIGFCNIDNIDQVKIDINGKKIYLNKKRAEEVVEAIGQNIKKIKKI